MRDGLIRVVDLIVDRNILTVIFGGQSTDNDCYGLFTITVRNRTKDCFVVSEFKRLAVFCSYLQIELNQFKELEQTLTVIWDESNRVLSAAKFLPTIVNVPFICTISG
jgi:hypothetical protein